jgi:hypothetical protein
MYVYTVDDVVISSIADLERKYFAIHNQFHTTSVKRGKIIAFFFVFAIFYIVSILWYTFHFHSGGGVDIHQTLRAVLIQVL